MNPFDELHLFRSGPPMYFGPRGFRPRPPAKESEERLREMANKTARHRVTQLYGEECKYAIKVTEGDVCVVARRCADTFLDDETVARDILVVVTFMSDVERKSVRELLDEIWNQVTSDVWKQFATRSTFSF